MTLVLGPCSSPSPYDGEWACIGPEDHFRVGQLPRGLPVVVGVTRTDTSSVLPFDMLSSLWTPRI
jgi:hypothetical protein